MKILASAVLAAVLTLGGAAANAASVTVGSFTFDNSAYADTSAVAAGSVFNVGNMVGGTLNSVVSGFGSGDVISFGFTDNTLVNGAGFDLLIFEGFSLAENSNLSLTLNGSSIFGTFQESATTASNFTVNIFAYDLSDLGVGAGQSVSGSLFITPTSISTPDIAAIAAIGSVAPVPLPAGLPLLLAGLGAFGIAARRKRKAA